MRQSEVIRKTTETDIKLVLNIDGEGKSTIDTGSAFLNHMLNLFAKHGKFDLDVLCHGDIDVDYHHTTEDIGICLGQAFKEALGNKAGINRYSDVILPMDEALVMVALDFSGRSYLATEIDIKASKVGDFDTELVGEFWQAFVNNAGCTLHIRQLAGLNAHHIIEAIFKACARALRLSVAIDPMFNKDIPSTKGVI